MVTSLVWLLLALAPHSPTPDDSQAVALPAPPTPPYAAWTQPGLVYVRHHPKPTSELAGALRRGDIVQVLEIVGDKDARHPWALINGGGALPLGALKPMGERPLEAMYEASDAKFAYGRVVRPHAPIAVAPLPHAAIRGHEKATYLMAFVPNPELQATGWLRRASGGYMRVADMEMLTPSRFHGEPKPLLPLAFVRRKTRLQTADKAAPAQFVSRYDRFHVLGIRAGRVQVAGGTLPRQFVRLAWPHARPNQIPKRAKWIRVDLAEQTLVAYEGDTPVFATLVSSGREPHPTQKGVFRIYAKTVHSTMRGRGWADYVAEEVPWAMHFYIGQALHGAYWHDQFGIVKSHGCVNLSPADAKWLFDWVPPALPEGWHTLLPGSQDPAVYVDVDSGATTEHTEPQPNAPTPTHQWTVDHQGGKKVKIEDVDKKE